jgi:hypothetical protein
VQPAATSAAAGTTVANQLLPRIAVSLSRPRIRGDSLADRCHGQR